MPMQPALVVEVTSYMPGVVTVIDETFPANAVFVPPPGGCLVQLNVPPALLASVAVNMIEPEVSHATVLIDMLGLGCTRTVAVAVASSLKPPKEATTVTIFV